MTEQQSRPLTGTDVRMLAGGYWGRYFAWRMPPRSKWLVLVGGCAFALLIILLAVTESADATSSGYRVLLVLLAAVGITTILAGFGIYFMDKEHYINRCVDRWERGDPILPDDASIVQYIRRSKRGEEDDAISV